eukprot:Skav210166  [mRNA]  locus=scaffold483:33391:33966:- [translate_table: standard]
MAHEQLDTLLELGVNFIDTAELYLDSAKRFSLSNLFRYPVPFEGGKVTEQWIGTWLEKALKDGKVQREKRLGADCAAGTAALAGDGAPGWWIQVGTEMEDP